MMDEDGQLNPQTALLLTITNPTTTPYIGRKTYNCAQGNMYIFLAIFLTPQNQISLNDQNIGWLTNIIERYYFGR